MTTWFAQNSSVNIDSVNQWNDAANGSGNWLTWANLGASDVLVANGKTSIAINVDVTCNLLTTAANGGTAGGGFTLNAGVNITANILSGGSICLTRSDSGAVSYVIGNIDASASGPYVGLHNTSTGSITVTGNVTGGLSYGIYNNSTGAITVTGNVTGGGYSGIYCAGTGSVTVIGDVTAGSNYNANGINGGGHVSVTGNVTASATAWGIMHYASNGSCTINGNITAVNLYNGLSVWSGNGVVYLNGNEISSAAGVRGVSVQSQVCLIHSSNTLTHTYRVNNSGVAGVSRSLYTGGTNLGQPTTANVRSGTIFGASSEYTGTLAVPSPTLVAIGVATDNTVGSYSPSVNASDIRTAVGLASANLDTQLSGIQNDADDIKAKTDNLPADPADQSAVEAAITSATSGLATELTAAAILEDTGTTIPALITTLNSRLPGTTVERTISDTNDITFAWPVSGATITGTVSLNNAAYAPVGGAIAFLRTEEDIHYYTLAYDADDRPVAEGVARYKFDDGTYTRFVNLRVAPADATAASQTVIANAIAALNDLSASAVNDEILDVLNVDLFGELAAPPDAESSLKDKLTWLFMWARNKATETALERKLFADDNVTVVSTESVTDDNITFTKTKAI